MAGIFGAVASGMQRKAADASALTWSRLLGADMAVHSGVSVTKDSALKVSTVLAATRVLAEGVAQSPLKVYQERVDGGADPAREHPAYKLLWRRPNDWMTSFELRETLMFHAVLGKGGYAYINRFEGRPTELLPLVPGNVTIRQSRDHEVEFEVRDADGRSVGIFPRSDVLHIRGPSWNGLEGLDIVQQAREAIGLAIATEETHARLHSNGTRPGGLLSSDAKLGDEARERLKAQWAEHYVGVQNAFKTVVLDGGFKWTPFSASGVDNQHIETRKHQIEEICRALRVFPQMVGYSDKTSTFASAEAFFLAHVVHSLQPWVERWEQAIDRDLLGDDMRYFAKFSLQGLLRGDHKSRAELYSSGIVNGWLTRNEARRWEELNPLPGLDEPLVPLNMGTQAERDAAAADIAETVKAMIGHNGGPGLDSSEIEEKIGRVLSSRNEQRIRSARDQLDTVLDSLPQE